MFMVGSLSTFIFIVGVLYPVSKFIFCKQKVYTSKVEKKRKENNNLESYTAAKIRYAYNGKTYNTKKIIGPSNSCSYIMINSKFPKMCYADTQKEILNMWVSVFALVVLSFLL